jgi:O-antigen biosynthesis protein
MESMLPEIQSQSLHLLDLPFDQYQRYRDVQEVVRRLRGGRRKLRILDVGGGEGGYLPAPDFFPDDQVVVADLHDCTLPHYVRASGLQLPFKDGSFDVVFSCDTLEHIPANHRLSFVRELFRVSSHFVLLIAPFHSALNVRVEERVREIHLTELGRPNQALLEHVENGLPDLRQIKSVFHDLSADVLTFASGNVQNWLFMNSIIFTMAGLSTDLYRAANRIYNHEFYERDHAAPAYRTCLVAAKFQQDIDLLQVVRAELNAWISLSGTAKNDGAEDSSKFQLGDSNDVQVWQQALAALRKTWDEKDSHIRNIEAVVHQKSNRIEDLEARLSVAERLLKKSNRIEDLEARLSVAERLLKRESAELQRIKGSAGWQLIQRYWAWNMRSLPYGSRRRMAYRKIAAGAARLLGLRTRSGAAGARQVRDEGNRNIVIGCDDPQPQQSCAGVFLVRGWAIARDGVKHVNILVDNQKISQAGYAQSRPDVAADFPEFPAADCSGFFYVWDSTVVPDGPHEITIEVESTSGQRRSAIIPIVVDQAIRNREFDRWIEANEPSAERLQEMALEGQRLTYRPLISIVMPVYRTPIALLEAAIGSLAKQIYPEWELCIADDGSNDVDLTRTLSEYAGRDSRIKVTASARNQGIAGATNIARALCTGEFIGFLDHDDELAPDALYHVAKLLQEHSEADVIYSDEDKLDLAGNRGDPFFKPDWSPDLLLSNNYICHFLVVRRQVLTEVNGLRSGFDGSQDYDLLLRLVERTTRVFHIPKILYHWRAAESSTAFSPGVKPKAYVAAERALKDYLQRNRIQARVEEGCAQGQWMIRYEVLGDPEVSIIMPTGGHLDLLQPCLDSLFNTTDYPKYRVLVVDNSRSSQVQDYIQKLSAHNELLGYLDYRGKKFNYSALNNFAVSQVSSPLVLFLNDDTTMVNEDWLTGLVEHGQRKSVGAVGAKLLYPSGSIQHAGVLMGVFDNTGHAFKNIPGNSRHYFCFPQITRNCSAVTAACMLTRRTVFQEIGGFDEKNLPVAFQDVDYCLKLGKAGYSIVYTPAAVLLHHESVTKHEKIPNMREVRYMQTKWADVIANDPFYSPNLTRKTEDYSLRLE